MCSMTKSTHTHTHTLHTALHTVHGTHTISHHNYVNEARQSVVSTCMSVCVRRSDAKVEQYRAVR